MLDWNTWAHDPARAAGHLVPQILAMLLTGGAAGAARGANASERLTAVSEEIDRLAATGTPVFEPVDQSSALKELAELGLDPATPSGQAAFKQLGSPYGGIDDWTDLPRPPGTRFALGYPGITEFGVEVNGEFTETDARSYFESLQVAGKRIRSGGDVPGPTMRPAVHIYEVSGENPVDAATAPTLNNPQFGPGGRQQVYTPEVYDLIESSRLQKVAEFRFDPKSLPSSTEDPVFRIVDPTLPRRPLTIGGATRKGALAGGAAGLLGSDAPVLTRTERAR